MPSSIVFPTFQPCRRVTDLQPAHFIVEDIIISFLLLFVNSRAHLLHRAECQIIGRDTMKAAIH